MIRTAILFIFVLSFVQISSAQHSLGLKAGSGISYVRGTTDYTGIDRQVLPSWSLYLGAFREWELSERSRLGLELTLNYYQGRDEIRSPLRDINGQITGFYHTELSKEFVYLSLPVWYGIEAGRWTLNLGLQASVQLGNAYWERTTGENNGVPINISNTDVIHRRLFADFGPRLALHYRFAGQWSIEASYYHGLFDAYKSIENSRYNILNGGLGIRYAF